MIFKGYLFSLLYGALCLAVAFLFYKLGMPKKYTRKLVHVCIGFEWVILNHYLGSSIHFFIVCLIFTALLALSHAKKLTPMIASEADNSLGTVYYGLAMSFMSLVAYLVPAFSPFFGIGVFCTSLGDGVAGLVGQLVHRANPTVYGKKTLLGCVSNALVSFAVAIVFVSAFELPLRVWHCVLIGFLSAAVELISSYGLDNISVTLSTGFFSYMLVALPTAAQYIVPVVVTPVMIALVLKKQALTRVATLLAVILDIVVSLVFGNFGFLLLLSFLVFSVIVDKLKKRRLRDDGISKKETARDGIQVIANGLPAMLMAIFYSFTFAPAFIAAYVAALAEALSDTVASGLGAFSRRTFDPFRRSRCEKGISGGVSLVGTLSALVAAFALSFLALGFGMIDWRLALLAAIAAFVGQVFDSLLGSLVQIKYRCPVCDKITERRTCCNKLTVRYRGFEFFDNDVVNLFSGLFASSLAAIVAFAI